MSNVDDQLRMSNVVIISCSALNIIVVPAASSLRSHAGSASTDANLISGPAYCQERKISLQVWFLVYTDINYSTKYNLDVMYTIHMLHSLYNLHINTKSIHINPINPPISKIDEHVTLPPSSPGSPWCSLP